MTAVATKVDSNRPFFQDQIPKSFTDVQGPQTIANFPMQLCLAVFQDDGATGRMLEIIGECNVFRNCVALRMTFYRVAPLKSCNDKKYASLATVARVR